MSSSVGMTIPNIWKVIKHVPNHQSDIATTIAAANYPAVLLVEQRKNFGYVAEVILYIKLRGTTWALRLDIATYSASWYPLVI